MTDDRKRNAVAVMNAKGGVGKSTLVLALAETLAALGRKSVLIIDSDSQASVSAMLMTPQRLYDLQTSSQTIVDLFARSVLDDEQMDWRDILVRDVSDVEDCGGIALLPSDMQLTLFEREVVGPELQAKLRNVVRTILKEASQQFDYVLVDCPPGLSILTEAWLRDADWHLSPTKPDYVSICGLEVFRRFKALDAEKGFAENLGVVINMMDAASSHDRDYEGWLRGQSDNRCISPPIMRSPMLQHASVYFVDGRSWMAKYPGHIGQAVRAVTVEILRRIEASVAAESGAADTFRASAKPVARESSPQDKVLRVVGRSDGSR